MSSLPGLNKKFFSFSQKFGFGYFWLPRSTVKVNFLNLQSKLQKIHGQFLGKSC